VIIKREESLGTVCALTREKARDLNVHDWSPGQQEVSKHHSEVIPAMQFVSLVHKLHLQATRYCIPHHFSRLFIADKN
jgi:hypothetical protein